MCIRWFRMQYKNLCIFSVPNGGSRHKIEAINLKKEGALAGVSDIICIFKDEVVFFELKAPDEHILNHRTGRMNKKKGGTQSDAQKDFESVCQSLGHNYHIIDNFDDFKKLVDFYACNNIYSKL